MASILETPRFKEYQVFAAYFTNVKNTKEIKKNLLKGNQAYDFAFINGDNLVSIEQIYSAVYKCLLDNSYKRTKSKTLHTEIIFNLAPQRNIMECLNKFGISDNSLNLIVLKIVKANDEGEFLVTNDQILISLREIIDGEDVGFNDETIARFADLQTIKNNYKLGASFTEEKDKLNRLLIGITQLKSL